MYSVSDEYLQAIRANVRTEKLTGRIALTDGTEIAFGPEDLMSGSVTIDNQCVSGEELQFGCVYLGQAAFQLKTEISRYKLYGATVTMTYSLQLADGSWYDVPLGVYTVGEAERSSVYVDIKAYDNIVKLEKDFDTDRLTGTMYDMLLDACSRCGLQMAQSREDLADDFPNTRLTFDLLTTDGCETYRDCVGVLAQMMAAFATVDRQGRLLIKPFAKKPCCALSPSERRSATVADYVCSYAGIKISGGENTYYCERTASGLTMTIADAPLFGKGTDERNQPMADAIMEVLADIQYVPASVTLAGDPALECGDLITITEPGGEAGASVPVLLTSYAWKYRGLETIKSVGKNPYLMSAKSSTDKALDKALTEAKTDSSTFYVYSTKTKDALHITDDEMTVATLDFATVDNTRIAFVMTSVQALTMDGNVVVRIYLDDELYHSYTDYEARGTNTLTVEFSMDVRGNARYRLRVTMQYGLFISDRRIDQADRLTLWNYSDAIVWSMASAQGEWSGLRFVKWDKIKQYKWEDLPNGGMSSKSWDDVRWGNNSTDPAQITYTRVQPDETHGTIDIDAGALGGVLFGRGLAATDVWDGTIHVQDYCGAVEIKATPFTVTDRLAGIVEQATFQTPEGESLGDVILPLTFRAVFALDSLPLDKMAGAIAPDADTLLLTGEGDSMDDIPITREIEDVRIVGGDDTIYAVSNDSGITWFNWTGEKWHKVDEGEGQGAAALVAANADNWNALCVDRLRFRWSGGACNYIEIKLEA